MGLLKPYGGYSRGHGQAYLSQTIKSKNQTFCLILELENDLSGPSTLGGLILYRQPFVQHDRPMPPVWATHPRQDYHLWQLQVICPQRPEPSTNAPTAEVEGPVPPIEPKRLQHLVMQLLFELSARLGGAVSSIHP